MKYVESDFNDQLKEKGYKITTQRKLILDVIKENEGNHLSSEEIYNLIKIKNKSVGIATVYRNLILLEEMGLIYKVELIPGNVCYELNDDKQIHKHHHLICIKCNRIIEVKEDLLENLEEKISSTHKFLIKDHSVKFYGYCENCR